MRFLTALVLGILLVLAMPVAAQDDEESDDMDMMACDYVAISETVEEAQALLEDEDIEGAQELLDTVVLDLEACEEYAMEDMDMDMDEDGDSDVDGALSELAGTPGEPVAAFLEGTFTGDFEMVGGYICEDLRDEALEVLSAIDMGDVEFEVDLSGLEYTYNDETEDSANVAISGVLTLSVAGQEVSQDAGELFGDTEIPVIKENDGWVICDNSIISGGF